MAASLLALCLGHAVTAGEVPPPTFAKPPVSGDNVELPAIPKVVVDPDALEKSTPGELKKDEKDKDGDKEKAKDADKEKEKDKDAPTLVFPRKDRYAPGTGNPYAPNRKGDEDIDFVVHTELPGTERLYRRDSEKDMFERIRQEAPRPGATKVYFPEEASLTRETYQGRSFPQRTALVEPNYVFHGRLYFEQLNMDRYGWDLGILQPAASVGRYYYDLAMLPYHLWSRPFDKYETSAGKCLPGDPAPLLLYPEPFSVTGLAGMTGTYVGGLFIFP